MKLGNSLNVETPRMMVNSCPSLKLLFHDTGHMAGTNTWRSHAGDLTWTLDGTLSLKDSYGVYASADQGDLSVTGTMPTPSGYGVAFCVGRYASSALFDGMNTIFGSNEGYYLTAYGTAAGGGAVAHSGTPSGNMDILGDVGCVIGIVDYVSAENPYLFTVRANAHGQYNTVNGAMIAGDNLISHTEQPLDSQIHNAPIILGATRAGSRCKMFGLFFFPVPFSRDELIASALYMAAKYGKMWPGFYGR